MERVTAAPEAYDGFGTETIERLPWSYNGQQFRIVRIPEAAQFGDWQIERYRSGLYPVFAPAELEEWLGLLKAKEITQ